MRRTRWTALAVLLGGAMLLGADSLAVQRTMPAGCGAVEGSARRLFEKRGFAFTEGSCVRCFVVKSKHLETPNGHRVFLTETAMHRYMDTRGDGELPPGRWMANAPVETNGELRLEQVQGRCRTALRFEYRWRTTQLVAVIPVDGGMTQRASNLRLEGEYLEALAHEFQEHH